MINQTTRYALHLLSYLARHPGRRVRSQEIARGTGVPANYLSKLLNQLRKRGLVDSEKGWGGGFLVKPEALSTRIGEILQIFEGLDSVERKDCLFGLPECDAENPCPLHPYWQEIREIYSEMLDGITIRDLGKRPLRVGR